MKVAVIGATGLVGSTILSLLENISGIEVEAFASKKSEGKKIKFRNSTLTVKEAAENNIQCDYALLSAGGAFSREIVPKLAEKGIVCIDNSSAFRKNSKYPLVVPMVNADKIGKAKIIANPNCSTIQTVMVLSFFKDLLRWVNYVTYQSLSGNGQTGIDAILKESFQDKNPKFMGQVIPKIGELATVENFPSAQRYEEEGKMIFETQKILNIQIPVDASCFRVPTLYCHGVYTSFGVRNPREATEILHGIHHPQIKIHPAGELVTNKTVVNTDMVHVMKFHQNLAPVDSFSYFCLADNLRIGAATNAVDILKYCLEN